MCQIMPAERITPSPYTALALLGGAAAVVNSDIEL